MEENSENQTFSIEEIKSKTGIDDFIKSNEHLQSVIDSLSSNNVSIDDIIDSDPELKEALNYLSENNVRLDDKIEIPETLEDVDGDDIVLIDDDSSLQQIDFTDIQEESGADDEVEEDLNDIF